MLGGATRQIRQEAGRGKDVREPDCDAYGKNLIKATLPGIGWALHHDAINLQVHWIARQSGLTSSMEVGDFFMRKMSESAIILDNNVHLLIKHLKGYVPDG